MQLIGDGIVRLLPRKPTVLAIVDTGYGSTIYSSMDGNCGCAGGVGGGGGAGGRWGYILEVGGKQSSSTVCLPSPPPLHLPLSTFPPFPFPPLPKTKHTSLPRFRLDQTIRTHPSSPLPSHPIHSKSRRTRTVSTTAVGGRGMVLGAALPKQPCLTHPPALIDKLWAPINY